MNKPRRKQLMAISERRQKAENAVSFLDDAIGSVVEAISSIESATE